MRLKKQHRAGRPALFSDSHCKSTWEYYLAMPENTKRVFKLEKPAITCGECIFPT